MPNSQDNQTLLAAVALVISVIALLVTVLQLLQQYFASARGFAQCNEKVMGRWAEATTRRLRLRELRIDVEFEAPVIFVSPPNYARGPVPQAAVHVLDGSDEKIRDTWTTRDLSVAMHEGNRDKEESERIHTADDERASWFVLLSAIQRMEYYSARWQKDQYKQLGPPVDSLPSMPPSLPNCHTMTVHLQRKRKLWITIPNTMMKPYATTTMCHMVEMMAMLGVYWREFDRSNDRYRAEGNGFSVLGERHGGLGLVFSFSIYGKCRFERNRVVPLDEVKELCFGYVPTIYRAVLDQRRLEFPDDELENMSSLQMGTRAEIAGTLMSLGCQNTTVRYFLDKSMKTTHLFPGKLSSAFSQQCVPDRLTISTVSFEILGMLSRTFHIENSSFTYIPNPTPDRWDRRSVSLGMLMEAYYELFSQTPLPEADCNPVLVERIKSHAREVLKYKDGSTALQRLLLLKALQGALSDVDEVLTARVGRTTGNASLGGTTATGTGSSPEKVTENDEQKHRRAMVQAVLRTHLREVLRLLNEQDDIGTDAQSLRVPQVASNSPTAPQFPSSIRGATGLSFDDVNSASPEDRQHVLMELYFEVIRPRIEVLMNSQSRRNSAVFKPPKNISVIDDPASTRTNEVDTPEKSVNSLQAVSVAEDALRSESVVNALREKADAGEPAQQRPLAAEPISYDDIWCTLVFRMICWLMLHDFHKLDVQISKSELLGSRMPVYIA